MSQHRISIKPWVVLVGGFLGAGKTTLILEAARMLKARNIRCAAILNDQSEELVDTLQAELRGIASREVTGGCFCCRLSDLRSTIADLLNYAPEVIFAEPVGSCTDLVATVLNPLLQEFELCRVAPFTVLVDPKRVEAMQGLDIDSDMQFLWRKQLQEADIVCMTKADIYPSAMQIPGVRTRRISARAGQGIAEWLDEVLSGTLTVGSQSLDIDYERYAQAEAALAWLNLSLKITLPAAASPAMMAGPLLDGIDHALTSANIPIVHLKMIARASTGWIKAALCANGDEPTVDGDLDASPDIHHELLLNLRAAASPEQVRAIIEEQVAVLPGEVSELKLACFSPAAPKPERRIPVLS
ncbi:GTP-binding protein [Acidicapsa dinghuensis]|uniref:GTP-binding protein n=1 Tax=Acidicapsa dinghuensis TaxID=2218256 RepID=A0ABW1EIV6_9BACT|nr:GTP-binding protein [Acidicapsa dinghuensis]